MRGGTSGNIHRDGVSVIELLIAKALRIPLWLLLSSALARLLEPSGMGTWSMILAAGMFVNQLFLHWTQSITLRFGRSEWLSVGRLDRVLSIRWLLLLAGIALSMGVVVAAPLDWPVRYFGLDDQMRWLIVPAMLAFWIMAETQSLQQVRERFAALAWTPVIADLVQLAIVISLIFFVSAGGGIGRNAIFLCVILTGLFFWSWCLVRELSGFKRCWRMPPREELLRAGIFAVPLIPGFLIGYLAEWGDYFLIRHYFSEREVGLFHPAYQYLLIMVGLPTALATVLLPRVVTAHDVGQGITPRVLIERHAPQFTVLWGVFALLAAAIIPTIFAVLLGDRYQSSIPVLQILLVAVPGAVVQHVYGVACFAQGRLGISTMAFFGAKCVLDLTLSYFLLPSVGVAGAAVASALSYVFLQWLFVIDQHRFLGLPFGAGVRAVLFVQFAGGAVALCASLGERILIALVSAVFLIFWARNENLFSHEEVSAGIPNKLPRLEVFCRRLLCRAH